MSQEVGSLLQKFESFLKRLQSGINKGSDSELVASKIKEVEVKWKRAGKSNSFRI
jgi:hypothetical protein